MSEVEIDLRDVERGIAAMLRRGRQLGPVFRKLRQPMRQDLRQHAKDKEGPDGDWPALAMSTVLARRGRRRRSRRLLGRLPQAVKMFVSTDSVAAVSRVPWSGVHQDGGKVGRGATIPKREFMWLSPNFLEKATDEIAESILVPWYASGG